MSQTVTDSPASLSPLEAVLRLIAATDPEPWRVRLYATQTGISLQTLEDIVEWLYLEKLVEHRPGMKGPSGEDSGPGFVLAPLGRRVLEEPELLERLRSRKVLVPEDVGATIRHVIAYPIRPVVARLLLFANLLVFGYGLVLAGDPALRQVYLTNFNVPNHLAQDYGNLLRKLGALNALDWLRGDWWRLLNTCFIHGGLLHLGMNMYMLHGFGRQAEQTWGRFRMLLIYLAAGWGGGIFGLAYHDSIFQEAPDLPMVGASGALCGLMGAHAVWVLLYSRHLPRGMARRGRSTLIVNIVLIVFVSLLPSVSAWGHLGGGVLGAATALVLHFQRFGSGVRRWVALLVLFVLPWPFLQLLERQRINSKGWHQVEITQFRMDHFKSIKEGMNNVFAWEERVEKVLELHPTRRDTTKVGQLLEELPKQQQQLQHLQKQIQAMGPYHSDSLRKIQKVALDLIPDHLELLEKNRICLEEQKRVRTADIQALEQARNKVDNQRQQLSDLLRALPQRPARKQ